MEGIVNRVVLHQQLEKERLNGVVCALLPWCNGRVAVQGQGCRRQSEPEAAYLVGVVDQLPAGEGGRWAISQKSYRNRPGASCSMDPLPSATPNNHLTSDVRFLGILLRAWLGAKHA